MSEPVDTGPLPAEAASASCEHAYASHHQPGMPVYWIRQCSLCRAFDAEDLTEQVRQLVAAAIPRCPTLCDADCEQACHEVHCMPRRRDHEPEACVGTMADAIRKLEREHIYAVLGNEHHVVFTGDGWTVEHSVECRLSGHMHECDWLRAVRKIADDGPDMPGRWLIEDIDGEGLPSLVRAR